MDLVCTKYIRIFNIFLSLSAQIVSTYIYDNIAVLRTLLLNTFFFRNLFPFLIRMENIVFLYGNHDMLADVCFIICNWKLFPTFYEC